MITGGVDEKYPVIKNGLSVHYPLDGNLNPSRVSPSGLNVLYQSQNNQANGHSFGTWLKNGGAIMTQSTDLSSVTVEQAKQYDLILADFNVWAVPTNLFPVLRTFVDAGISCVAVGNDTKGNHFVSEYNGDTSIHASHDILIDVNSPLADGKMKFSGGSGDLNGGIIKLANNARPLYYRADAPELITGYYYESPSTGAVLYVDQEGMGAGELVQKAIMWAVNRTSTKATSSNITIVDDGAWIEANATNLLSNGDFQNGTSGWNPWGSPSKRELLTQTTFNGSPVIHLVTTGTNQGFNRTVSVKPGSTYTLSAWTYLISGQSVIMGYVDGNYPTARADTTKMGEWQRITLTFTVSSSTSATISIGRSGAGINGEYYMTNVQLEERDYATYFNSGKIGDGTLSIPTSIASATSNFSLNYWIRPNGVKVSDSNARVELVNFGKIYRYFPVGGDTANRRYIWDYTVDSGTSRVYKDLVSATEFSTTKTEMITITFDRINTRIYRNGVLWATSASTSNCKLGLINEIKFHNTSAKIQDVSIYDRALPDGDILRMYQNTFRITKSGDMQGKVKEEAISPKSGLHFPLGNDGKDKMHSVSPVTESNTVYEDGAVWIGQATTNLANVNAMEGFENSGVGVRTKGSTDIPRLYPDADVMKYEIKSVDANSGIADGNIQVGKTGVLAKSTTHSASCWVWLDVDPSESRTIYLRQYHDGGNKTIANLNYNGKATPVGQLPQKKWIKLTLENASTGSEANPNLRICLYLSKPGSKAYFTAPHIEAKPFNSPYVFTSRAVSMLHLPYDTIKLTENFTIFGWWKPKTIGNNTYNPALTYNRRSSDYTNRRVLIMENGTTSKTLRVWLPGTASSEYNIILSGSEIQYDKWNFFALRRNGTNVTLFHGFNGKVISGTDVSAGVGFDYLDTVVDSNWGWMIGDYSDASQTGNAYFRDYTFIQSVLSDSDIESIYKTQTRAYKDSNVQIRGELKEGEVL